MDYKETAQHLVNEIGRAKSLTNAVDMHEVFLSAENIISCLAYLIKPLMDLEHAYRKDAIAVVKHTSDIEVTPGKWEHTEHWESQSQAEARAKAGENYKEWQKLKMLIELGEHQINILKKFKEDIAMEKRR